MSVRRFNPYIPRSSVPEITSLYQPKKRQRIGEPQKQRLQNEREQATSLEGDAETQGLFSLHHVDWVHFETVKDSKGTLKAGFPDYFIVGDGWTAYLEIKARNPKTKRPGKTSPVQDSFHDRLRAAGHDVMVALLPDQLQEVNLWLREKTGIVCHLDGVLR